MRISATGIIEKERVEKILRDEGYSVFEWSDPPGTNYPLHTHAGDEVRWIVAGEMTLGIAGAEYVCVPGHRIDIAAGEPHWAFTVRGVRYLCGSR